MVRTPLDISATTDFARELYGAQLRPSGRSYRALAEHVSELAQKLLLRHHREIHSRTADERHWVDTFLPPPIPEHVEWVQHAGILSSSMYRFGATWEELCELTNPNVATLVGNSTPDGRLSPPLRDNQFKGQIAGADLNAQVLCFADTLSTLEEYGEWIKRLHAKPASNETISAAGEFLVWETSRIEGVLMAVSHTLHRGSIRRWLQQAQDSVTQLGSEARLLLRPREIRERILANRKDAEACPKRRSSTTSTKPSSKKPGPKTVR